MPQGAACQRRRRVKCQGVQERRETSFQASLLLLVVRRCRIGRPEKEILRSTVKAVKGIGRSCAALSTAELCTYVVVDQRVIMNRVGRDSK